MYSAKDSFSHKSSHHCGVTRSPNHMCDISCKIVFVRAACCARVGAERNRYFSVNVTRPGFSMAPKLYSGTKMESYLPQRYGKSKLSWKKSIACQGHSKNSTSPEA